MSSTQVATPLSEIEEGVKWASENHHVHLDKMVLKMLIELADKKRKDENHPLGVQEAKRDALKDFSYMPMYKFHKQHRNVYSSTMSHVYGLRAAKKAAKEKPEQVAPQTEDRTSPESHPEVYDQIRARTGERD